MATVVLVALEDQQYDIEEGKEGTRYNEEGSK